MPRFRPAIVILVFGALLSACRETGDVQVTSITFVGTSAVKAEELKAVIATEESGSRPWSRKRFFDRPEFDQDVKRIQAYYADKGYPTRRSSTSTSGSTTPKTRWP